MKAKIKMIMKEIKVFINYNMVSQNQWRSTIPLSQSFPLSNRAA